MLFGGRPAVKLARLGVFFLVIGIVDLAAARENKGNGALVVVFGAVLIAPWLWNARRAAQATREDAFGPPPPLPPALVQLLDQLGAAYRSDGDLLPGQVQSAAAALGLNPIPHERGNLDQVAAAVGSGRRAILFVNTKALPGRRPRRSWYPIVVLALGRSHGRTVAQIADPTVGRPEQLDAKRLVSSWKADDRFLIGMNVLRALSSGKPPSGAPRMWLEI